MSVLRSRTAKRSNVAIAACALVVPLATILAVVNLRKIAEPTLIDVAVPTSATSVREGLVHGIVGDGLPPYVLHWDGQPPSAILVDASTGRVLAAAAFSDTTFSANRNAVRFTSGLARFTLDARRYRPASSLLLRFEVVKPRGTFLFWSTLAAAATIALMVLLAFRGADRLQIAGSLTFIAVACGTFATLFPGAPVRVDEVTDAASINSFAAALDHPARFAFDRLLSDPFNYRWYPPAYVDLVRVFAHAGFHYQTAMAFLGGGAALLLLFGLRRLFVTISGHEAFALAATLTLGLMLTAQLPSGESWSILEVLPKTVFTAFVPWVILLALFCAPWSRRWWIAAGAAGLLMNIHPRSAPAMIGALVTAFVIGSDEPVSARGSGAALAVMAALATMSPYLVVYARHVGADRHLSAATAARAVALQQAYVARAADGRRFVQLIAFHLRTYRVLLDALVLVLLARCRVDRCFRLLLGAAAGLSFVTYGIPWIERLVGAHLHRALLEQELVSNVRYFDLLLAAALAVGIAGWSGTRRQRVTLVAIGAVCTVLIFGPGWFDTAWAMAGRSRLSWRILRGEPDRESRAAQEAIRAVKALQVPNGRVSGPVGLRQFGVPLAWIPRDVESLSYAPSSELVESADVVARAAPILSSPLTEESVSALASILEAQLFLVRRRQIAPSLEASETLLFENDAYAIVAAPPKRVRDAGGKVGRSTARETVGVSSAAT